MALASRETSPARRPPSSAGSRTTAREPDHVELDYGHGRIIKRSLRITGARGLDFPHAAQVARIRRDCRDLDGILSSKEIVHAVTSLGAELLYLAGVTEITRTLQATGRDRTRMLSYPPI
jgi:hypothetical protein